MALDDRVDSGLREPRQLRVTARVHRRRSWLAADHAHFPDRFADAQLREERLGAVGRHHHHPQPAADHDVEAVGRVPLLEQQFAPVQRHRLEGGFEIHQSRPIERREHLTEVESRPQSRPAEPRPERFGERERRRRTRVQKTVEPTSRERRQPNGTTSHDRRR